MYVLVLSFTLSLLIPDFWSILRKDLFWSILSRNLSLSWQGKYGGKSDSVHLSRSICLMLPYPFNRLETKWDGKPQRLSSSSLSLPITPFASKDSTASQNSTTSWGQVIKPMNEPRTIAPYFPPFINWIHVNFFLSTAFVASHMLWWIVFLFNSKHFKISLVVRELGQWLRTFVALTKDLGSIFIIHMGAHNCL